LLRVVSTPSSTSKASIGAPLPGARKNKDQKKILKSYYNQYLEGMDEKQWTEATKKTSMNKAQINKYLWDLKNRTFKNEQIAKRQCGIIFEIYNTKTK